MYCCSCLICLVCLLIMVFIRLLIEIMFIMVLFLIIGRWWMWLCVYRCMYFSILVFGFMVMGGVFMILDIGVFLEDCFCRIILCV